MATKHSMTRTIPSNTKFKALMDSKKFAEAARYADSIVEALEKEASDWRELAATAEYQSLMNKDPLPNW